MNPWIRITRPVNGIMGIVATIISAYIGSGSGFPGYADQIAAACLCVFLVTAGGNVINDITDAETDRINHPDRPIPMNQISLSAARNSAAIIFVSAIVLSVFFIGIISTCIVLLAEAVLIAYELRTKKLGLSGNISVSILVGLIFLFGGIAVGSYEKMLILFGMASLANFSREIIKGVEDMEGDLDRRTFPRVYGVNKSAILASVAVAIAVILSFLPYLLGIFNWFYLVPVVISDAMFISTLTLIKNSPGKGQKISKGAMIVGLASFVVGAI